MSKTITVSDETFELIKDQLAEEEQIDISSLEDLVGLKLYVRTVTYHLFGTVESVAFGKFLKFSEASWVADTTRLKNFFKDGDLRGPTEMEPLGDWYVNMETVTDFGIWKYDLEI